MNLCFTIGPQPNRIVELFTNSSTFSEDKESTVTDDMAVTIEKKPKISLKSDLAITLAGSPGLHEENKESALSENKEKSGSAVASSWSGAQEDKNFSCGVEDDNYDVHVDNTNKSLKSHFSDADSQRDVMTNPEKKMNTRIKNINSQLATVTPKHESREMMESLETENDPSVQILAEMTSKVKKDDSDITDYDKDVVLRETEGLASILRSSMRKAKPIIKTEDIVKGSIRCPKCTEMI